MENVHIRGFYNEDASTVSQTEIVNCSAKIIGSLLPCKDQKGIDKNSNMNTVGNSCGTFLYII